MKSFVPTYGRVLLEAMVEIMTFGKPAGNERITPVPMMVPIAPPMLIIPPILPSL